MAEYEAKTKPTAVDVDAYLDAIPDEGRRADAQKARAMIERLSGEPARMWGPSIVGCGRYHYKYDSGHEGESARLAFSPRAKELVFYIMPGFERYAELMARLGKHRTGKCCLYIKRLVDVDEKVLETLVRASQDYMRETYPE
jgi:hypothetical protein